MLRRNYQTYQVLLLPTQPDVPLDHIPGAWDLPTHHYV